MANNLELPITLIVCMTFMMRISETQGQLNCLECAHLETIPNEACVTGDGLAKGNPSGLSDRAQDIFDTLKNEAGNQVDKRQGQGPSKQYACLTFCGTVDGTPGLVRVGLKDPVNSAAIGQCIKAAAQGGKYYFDGIWCFCGSDYCNGRKASSIPDCSLGKPRPPTGGGGGSGTGTGRRHSSQFLNNYMLQFLIIIGLSELGLSLDEGMSQI